MAHHTSADLPRVTGEEWATLPPMRHRLVAQAAGLVGLAVGIAWLLLLRRFGDWSDDLAHAHHVSPVVSIPAVLLVMGAPWLLARPLLAHLGYDWLHIVFAIVAPFYALVLAWGTGFRLTRLPYRDWPPSKKQRSAVRPIRGTPYHVLQSDLDRYAVRSSVSATA